MKSPNIFLGLSTSFKKDFNVIFTLIKIYFRYNCLFNRGVNQKILKREANYNGEIKLLKIEKVFRSRGMEIGINMKRGRWGRKVSGVDLMSVCVCVCV